MIIKKGERILKEKENEWQRDTKVGKTGGDTVTENDIRKKKGRVTGYTKEVLDRG